MIRSKASRCAGEARSSTIGTHWPWHDHADTQTVKPRFTMKAVLDVDDPDGVAFTLSGKCIELAGTTIGAVAV
jgi:hypothetical protein